MRSRAFHGLVAIASLASGPMPAGCRSNPGDATRRMLVGDPALPGITGDPAASARLEAAVRSRGADDRPRTRHLLADGRPKYTNRLIFESSPYLLQHAHNPVNWYPWGDEAFDRAARERKPILLSIGYSTCHWCHVMEEESFEDEEIARYLNENYVAIKVDREVRPDLDGVYMAAVQRLTGGGGWPMTVWLSPDRKPFYGGTYFPPRDGARGARTGFLTILRRMREIYNTQPDRVAQAADELADLLRAQLQPAPAGGAVQAEVLDRAAAYFRARFDSVHGGTLGAPKFPSNLPVRFLLRQHRRTGDVAWRAMAEGTLAAMAAGGIHDQIGGGFHRYATDETWLVPHFEKMLYDNALLMIAYLEAYQVTGREDFAEVVRGILRWFERDMSAPEGGLYSATDADSPIPGGRREEGWFFTWTPDELRTVLGAEAAAPIAAYYGVTESGNFEGRSVLSVPRPLEVVAGELRLDPRVLRTEVERARVRLEAARRMRPAPLRDDKILASWNGLAISAMARAGLVLDLPAATDRAARAAEFLFTRQMQADRLRHASGDDGPAYLDDYAFVIAGCLDLYEASGDPRWLGRALQLDAVLERHYEDPAGGFFFTSDDHETLLAREKPSYDGAEPSGNSVQALNLLRLHEFTTSDRFRTRAERLFAAFGERLGAQPAALAEMLLAVDFRFDRPGEIVIVTPRSRAEAAPFLEELRRTFLPNAVLVVTAAGEAARHLKWSPLAGDKPAQGGRTTAYVCERGICELPAVDAATFGRQIRARSIRHGG